MSLKHAEQLLGVMPFLSVRCRLCLPKACSRTGMSSWLGHGCSGKNVFSNMDVIMVWGHGCSGKGMLWNMDVIMVWTWMLW